ncbi:hypothetical protein [Blattabacterium cuenoti]|uniref:hypothetical protein n=1 Tax=Blattabacterium cuenoti TaxID=1653831 RepID=UPI00163C9630|nr:hypothetical protein [Blattabacterium cuenoti]
MKELDIEYIINNVPSNTVTVDRSLLENISGKNIYHTICILNNVCKKINEKIKYDLDKRLEEFNITNKNNNLEEIFENREQIELSKFYEGLPKSTSISIQCLIDKKIKL